MLHIVYIKLLNESWNQVRIWLLLCTSQVATQGAAGCIRVGMLGQICDLTVHVCILQSLMQRNTWRDSNNLLLLSVPGHHRFVTIRTRAVPLHPEPLPPASLLRLFADADSSGCREGATGVQGCHLCRCLWGTVGLGGWCSQWGRGNAYLFWLASCLAQGHTSSPGWDLPTGRIRFLGLWSNGPMSTSGRDPLWGKAEEAESP